MKIEFWLGFLVAIIAIGVEHSLGIPKYRLLIPVVGLFLIYFLRKDIKGNSEK